MTNQVALSSPSIQTCALLVPLLTQRARPCWGNSRFQVWVENMQGKCGHLEIGEVRIGEAQNVEHCRAQAIWLFIKEVGANIREGGATHR